MGLLITHNIVLAEIKENFSVLSRDLQKSLDAYGVLIILVICQWGLRLYG